MSTTTMIGGVKRSFTATTTIAQYSLVDLETDGSVGVATLTSSSDEVRVGFADRAAGAGESVPVCLLNGGGSAFGIAAATVTAADALYGASTGKVSSTASGSVIGYALQDAVADDVIEILLS